LSLQDFAACGGATVASYPSSRFSKCWEMPCRSDDPTIRPHTSPHGHAHWRRKKSFGKDVGTDLRRATANTVQYSTGVLGGMGAALARLRAHGPEAGRTRENNRTLSDRIIGKPGRDRSEGVSRHREVPEEMGFASVLSSDTFRGGESGHNPVDFTASPRDHL
jgi:hypothetical protein